MSRMSDEKMEEFEALARPLIKFLNDNFHPHVQVTVTPTGAQIQEEVMGFYTEDYIKD